MAGRFVSHKFVSGICRSTSRLTARASPSARATDPIVPRALEAGIRNNSNVFHGAAVQPGTAVPNNCAIHSYAAARHLGTSPWSCAATKAGCPTTGMPSTVIKKPTFPVSVGGMKRTYSSGAPNKLGHSWGAKLAAWRDRGSVLKLRIAKKLGPDEGDKGWITLMFLATCIGFWFFIMSLYPTARDYGHGRSGSRGCSGCCHCLAGGSKS